MDRISGLSWIGFLDCHGWDYWIVIDRIIGWYIHKKGVHQNFVDLIFHQNKILSNHKNIKTFSSNHFTLHLIPAKRIGSSITDMLLF